MTYIDSSIASIVAREFLEGTMFIFSYFGAVAKNCKMEDHERIPYYQYMTGGVLAGVFGGLMVSLGVGFGLKAAFESGMFLFHGHTSVFLVNHLIHYLGGGLDAEIGIETGEGISKLIGFFFVAKMMLKIPKWFGISNFERIQGEQYNRPNDPLGNMDVDSVLEAKETMAFTLFWNVFREMAEVGSFVSIEAFLSAKAM